MVSSKLDSTIIWQQYPFFNITFCALLTPPHVDKLKEMNELSILFSGLHLFFFLSLSRLGY